MRSPPFASLTPRPPPRPPPRPSKLRPRLWRPCRHSPSVWRASRICFTLSRFKTLCAGGKPFKRRGRFETLTKEERDYRKSSARAPVQYHFARDSQFSLLPLLAVADSALLEGYANWATRDTVANGRRRRLKPTSLKTYKADVVVFLAHLRHGHAGKYGGPDGDARYLNALHEDSDTIWAAILTAQAMAKVVNDATTHRLISPNRLYNLLNSMHTFVSYVCYERRTHAHFHPLSFYRFLTTARTFFFLVAVGEARRHILNDALRNLELYRADVHVQRNRQHDLPSSALLAGIPPLEQLREHCYERREVFRRQM